ncbi:MAG: CBS domain-containing protein [Chloroflexota bacterium]
MTTIKRVLDRKGSAVITYYAHHDLGTACKVMQEYNIGALPIVNKVGELVGIFSERDVVHIVAEMEENALSMPISVFMTANVVTIANSESLSTARNLMKRGGFRHLPVVEHGELIGLISLSDVVESLANEMESLVGHYQDYIATS